MGYGYRSLSMYILFLQPWGGARDGGRKKWAGRGVGCFIFFKRRLVFFPLPPSQNYVKKKSNPCGERKEEETPIFLLGYMYVLTDTLFCFLLFPLISSITITISWICYFWKDFWWEFIVIGGFFVRVSAYQVCGLRLYTYCFESSTRQENRELRGQSNRIY